MPIGKYSLRGVLTEELPSPAFGPLSKIHADTGDFLVLPAGASIPDTVSPPAYEWPRICSVDGSPVNPPPAVYAPLASAEDLVAQGGFPMYKLSTLPPDTTSDGAGLTSDSQGRRFAGGVYYKHCNPNPPFDCHGRLSITADLHYPHPFPLFEDDPLEDGPGSLVVASYLPTTGYIHLWQTEYQLYWIEDSILYTLFADRTVYPDPQAIASTLIKVV